MNDIQKVPQPVLHHDLTRAEQDFGSIGATNQQNMTESIIKPAMRHWRAALITFIAAVAVGVPVICLFIEPQYESVGAIRVAPIQQSIVYRNPEGEASLTNYQAFMNTQVDLMGSFHVLDRAAEALKKKKLAMIQPDPVTFLRDSIANKSLKIESPENTELIKVTMKSKTPPQAEEIVNELIKSYMTIESTDVIKGGDEKLAVLDDKLKELSEKREQQKKIMRQLSEEFGTSALTDRQQMMLQQVVLLQTEITKVQTKRVDIETQIQMLEKNPEGVIPLERVLSMRNEFVKTDTQLNTLSNNVAQLEQGLVVATQTMTPENPELKTRKDLLAAMKKRLAERQDEISKAFDDMLKSESARNRDYKLSEVKAELERTVAYEDRLNTMLAKHNNETVALGRKQLAIKDQQEQFALTDEMYNTISRRIQEMEVEKKRPAQISVAYMAASMLAKDQRFKLIIANVFGAAMCGLMFAMMLDRTNRRVNSPEDITKRIGIRLLGTTVNSSKLNRSLLQERITDDFQTIRANLGLFSDEKIPHTIAVTSANSREGKTTFAINLATSMAKAGTKVLLIDGDMRKPEIGLLLKHKGSYSGVRKVLLGYCGPQESVWSIQSIGLDVLCSDKSDSCDCFEILTRPQTARYFENLCSKYENVIIDTPPVLAVPDTMLWAKMVDAVVLTSFAGQTPEQDLQKALERLKQIDARVLGVVVNNVSIRSSYNYGYGYGYGYGRYGSHKESNEHLNRGSILLSAEESDRQNVGV